MRFLKFKGRRKAIKGVICLKSKNSKSALPQSIAKHQNNSAACPTQRKSIPTSNDDEKEISFAITKNHLPKTKTL